MPEIDFKLIRVRMTIFAIVLFSCIAITVSSFLLLESRRDANKLHKGAIRANQSAITKILNDISLLHTFQNDYDAISLSGFLSSEKRLSWIEQLELSAARLQLSNMQYQIDPQQQVQEGNVEIPSNIELFKSKLSFETNLLHEGDLLDIVNELIQLSSGLPVLERCAVNRVTSSSEIVATFNFNANCDIAWYTANYNESSASNFEAEP